MPDTSVITSESEKMAERGAEIACTVESFVAPPDAPAGAKDIQRSHEDGKFTLRYTILAEGSPVTYTINGSVSQEPIATHPMFQAGDLAVTDAEWKKWKIWDADKKDPELNGWEPDGATASAGMKKYFAYRNKGVDDYLLGTVTMRIVQEDQNAPNLANLGRIATPSGAPSLPNGRNWLMTGIDGERIDNARWKVTREYRASGAGGWDQDIYSKA